MSEDLVAATSALRQALAGFDPALLSGADCAALVVELATVEKACAGARARAAVRAVDCGAHRELGWRDPNEWLARQSGSSSGQARSELETATLLDGCSATREAVTAGELSLTQAREITRTEQARPGSEAELLAVAKREPLHVLKDKARKRRVEQLDANELRRRQRASREFRHWRDELGMIRFSGALTPEVGVPFVNRLDAETDRVWRSDKDKRVEPRRALAADAFAKLIETGGKGKNRQADLTVVIDSRKLAEGDGADGPCHIIGGGPIPVDIARSIARDAFLKIVLHDGVEVQRVAHVGRHWPAELRTALLLGVPPDFDGIACADEGCGRRYGLECDHVDPVANGGPTALWNGKWRCQPHHQEKTEADRRAGLLDRKRPTARSRP